MSGLVALQDRLAKMLHVDIRGEHVTGFTLDVQGNCFPRLVVEREVLHVQEMSTGFTHATSRFRLVPEDAFDAMPDLEEVIKHALNQPKQQQKS